MSAVPLMQEYQQRTSHPISAEVIAQFTPSAVIGLAGVDNFKRGFGVALKSLGVRQARIAFDADRHTKPGVTAALNRLYIVLRDAGLAVSIFDWHLSEGKGLDDVLTKEVA